MIWRNAMHINEHEHMKSGNAEPYARLNEGKYRGERDFRHL